MQQKIDPDPSPMKGNKSIFIASCAILLWEVSFQQSILVLRERIPSEIFLHLSWYHRLIRDKILRWFSNTDQRQTKFKRICHFKWTLYKVFFQFLLQLSWTFFFVGKKACFTFFQTHFVLTIILPSGLPCPTNRKSNL